MREIKFRAWKKDTKNWCSRVNMYINGCGEMNYILGGETESYCKPDEYEVMQYIGLKDKDGIEIYEGDILRIGDDLIEEVKWVGVGDWFGKKQPMVGFVSHGTIYKDFSIEVIGNIYENPELLESKE